MVSQRDSPVRLHYLTILTLLIIISTPISVGKSTDDPVEIHVEGTVTESIVIDGEIVHIIYPSKVTMYGQEASTLYTKGLPPLGTLEVSGADLLPNQEYDLIIENSTKGLEVIKMTPVEPDDRIQTESYVMYPLVILALVALMNSKEA